MKKSRRYYDVTMTIKEGMISWPSDGPVKVERVRSMEKGDRLNQSRLDMSAHTGTHIDAPVHFVDGAAGISAIALDNLMGSVLVVDLTGLKQIGRENLLTSNIPDGTKRLILKTDNSDLIARDIFEENFCYLTEDGAKYLLEKGIKLVGIDYLSIAEYGKGEVVHRALLSSGIVIIEGLDLRGVPAGIYQMTALPLKIAGCDGAPARVVLIP